MKTLHVGLDDRSYDIHIAPGLLSQAGALCRAALPRAGRLAVVTDSHVGPLYGETIMSSLAGAGFQAELVTIPAGESSKCLSMLGRLYDAFTAQGLTRSDGVVALGGGVVGDLAGFAAATILRGVDFVQIPTTLLAQVDSSVGGKVAIDLPAGKNLAGAFLQPAAVLCDTDCLSSLPAAVFADGAAEAIKTGVLCDESLFSLFESGTLAVDPAQVIARCVAYKAGVVERDEREQNERRLLNLGHTVGHAIEVCSGYTIPHGHAVAAGLAVIARSAERLGWTEGPLASRVGACLAANGLPTGADFSPEGLAEAASRDKKRAGGEITLVIPRRIGACQLRTVPVEELLPIIRAGWEA